MTQSLKTTGLRAILAFGLLLFVNSLAADNHALIIALSDYSSHGDHWKDLSAADDARIIQSALIQKGFKEDNIQIFEAGITKEDIVKSIEQQLMGNLSAGDVAHLHISAHGQQVADDNGDEIDGLDECIVPLSAPSRSSFRDGDGNLVKYDGSQHLRDDELGVILRKIRKKLGPKGNLFVTIDACHSGSATRGLGSYRGSREVISNEKPGENLQLDEVWLGHELTEKLAPMVSFFGSGAHQLNFECEFSSGEKYGSLSYALSKALIEGGPKQTYRQLFTRVRSAMSILVPNQRPQAEGMLNQEVFGGKLTSEAPIFLVTEAVNDSVVIINGGELHGLFTGTQVKLNHSESSPISGVIIESGATHSKIKTQLKINVHETDLYEVITEGKALGHAILTVAIDVKSLDLREDLTRSITDHTGFEISSESVDLTIQNYLEEGSRNTSKLIAVLSDGSSIGTAEIDANDNAESRLSGINQLLTDLSQYAKARFLRNLSISNQKLNAELELTALEFIGDPSQVRDPNKYLELDSNGSKKKEEPLRIEEGTPIRLKIHNKCGQNLYYAVIGVSPNNDTYIIYPETSSTGNSMPAEDYMIRGFSSIENSGSVLMVGPPYGTETLKLLASRKPITGIQQAMNMGIGTNTRSISGGIAGALANGLFPNYAQGFRSVTSTLKPEDLAIFTFEYQIVPK